MIVRDEEDYIGDAIRSVSSLVNEIVVVDTGSRDSSPGIARAFGAKLISLPWQGDFSKAHYAPAL